ncbi:hypothetical protein [Hymenobacter nivis]|uniref:hypothetical protein n=1 Tax=Hymenobacter nivis TaxID=1850093 RepID=UPI0013754562|nr:hypothetical protein [Hymenobacter nivis]
MNNSRLFAAALLLALPVAAHAQTKPAAKTTTAAKPATEQVTEVTEDLDPATGKVIRRTTRTTTLPAGTALPSGNGTAVAADGRATDAQVSDFFREKTTVGTLTAPALLDAYTRFIEKVRNDRRTWNPADWSAAAAVLSSLNGRYDQVRANFVLDDKVTIRSQQAEFQALRTTRQISDQVSNKL